MAAAKKAPAKKSAKAAAKKAAAKKATVKKAAASKSPAKKAAIARSARPVAKAAGKPAARVVAKAATKHAVVKPAAVRPAAAKPAAAKPAPARSASVRAERPVASPMPSASLIPAVPAPAPRPVAAPSPKDLAAAHEYLLARSATRSEEPVLVNGRRLPSEGDLLKMPESAYMNEQQLAFFKHRLQTMERELLQNAGETTEHLRETVIVPDPADRATIEEEHALELRTRDRERKLLKKVQQALARIDSGDYGYCEETGDPIGIPRLLARPTATLSLEAQQRREIKQKMYGD
jgi:RNA polymerase-binding transcription factor